MLMNRVKANDPNAVQQMGATHYQNGDYQVAFEHYAKAAELGNSDA